MSGYLFHATFYSVKLQVYNAQWSKTSVKSGKNPHQSFKQNWYAYATAHIFFGIRSKVESNFLFFNYCHASIVIEGPAIYMVTVPPPPTFPTFGHWFLLSPYKGKILNFSNPTLLRLNVNFRVLASGSLPGNMTFRRNNVRLESLGFFPCMAQVQPMPNKELLSDV